MGGGLEKHRGSLKSCVTWRRNECWGGEGVGTWQEKDLLVEVKESSQGERKEKRDYNKQTEQQPAIDLTHRLMEPGNGEG